MRFVLALLSVSAGPPPPVHFDFSVDWAGGGPGTTLPTSNFSIRKLEAIVYPGDNYTYAYADIVNYTDPYYPVSYSSEVGVFSSRDGRTGWVYHGIVVGRGAPGAWDGAGIASPGASVAADGTVLVGWCGENNPTGGINRGIGVSVAPHPLGPFTKLPDPVATPTGVCGGAGRCDDVIMQSRPDGVHLYHSVKGSDVTRGCGDPGLTCIRHRRTTDAGRTWSDSTIVLTRRGGMETFAGRFFPGLEPGGGEPSPRGKGAPQPARGAMVLITDGGPGGMLTPFVSSTGGAQAMLAFAPASPATLQAHPPIGPQDGNPGVNATKGDWQLQIGLIPGADGAVVGVSYSQFTGEKVYCRRYKADCGAYTHTVYPLELV